MLISTACLNSGSNTLHKPTFVERNRSHFYNQSRVDKNQKSLVAAFRSLGWYVLHTNSLKHACDLMVIKKGRVVAVEIKDGSKSPSKRQLSEGEKLFKTNWRASGGEWRLVESVDDVVKVNKK